MLEGGEELGELFGGAEVFEPFVFQEIFDGGEGFETERLVDEGHGFWIAAEDRVDTG